MASWGRGAGRRALTLIPRLHLVTDDRVLASDGFFSAAKEAMKVAGALAAFHLRGPCSGARRLWKLGGPLRNEAGRSGVTFLVNDRVDLALVLDADGAQLGERSLSTRDVRAILGPSAILGRSVHDEATAMTERGVGTKSDGANFLFAGPVFQTPSHAEHPGIGTDGLARIVEAAGGIPVLAIGGFEPTAVSAALRAGAHGVAVIRSAWAVGEVGHAIERFVQEFERAEEGS